MKFIIWTMRPEIRPWAHFSIFPCFSHGDASVEPPGFEKHAAAPKQGIGFANENHKKHENHQKAEKSYPQGLKFMEKHKNHDYGKIKTEFL